MGTRQAMTILHSRRNLLIGNLIATGSMVAWAAGFPAAEYLLATWDPPVLAAARFLVGFAILLAIWLAMEGAGSLRRGRWGKSLLIGGVGFGGGAYFILLSQAMTDPVTVAIFASASPLVAAVVDAIWDGRRFGLPFVLGLVAAVAGGIIATGGGAPGDIGLGALFAVLSCLAFVWGTMMMNRHLTQETILARSTMTIGGGALMLTVVSLAMAPLGLVGLPTGLSNPNTWLALGVYGLVALSISQFLWTAAAVRLGLTAASFHINIAPFWTMLIMLGLGGTWSWPQALGAAVVAAGVLLAQR